MQGLQQPDTVVMNREQYHSDLNQQLSKIYHNPRLDGRVREAMNY
jgi:hypothetical protein